MRARHLHSEKILGWGMSIYFMSTLVSMAVMSVGAVVFIVSLLIYYGGPAKCLGSLWKERRRPAFLKYAMASAVLAIACVLSLVVAKAFPLSYGGRYARVTLLVDSFKLWYLILPFLLGIALGELSASWRRRLFCTWLIGFGLLSTLGVLQHFFGWPRPQRIPTDLSRFHTTLFLGHHLSVASIFIFPFFALVDQIKISMGRWCVLAVATTLVGFLALFFTYSRGLWLALPIGLMAYLFLILPRRMAWASLTGVIAVCVGLFFFQSDVWNRFNHSLGFNQRFDLWEANLKFFEERPLTGSGWKKNQELSGYYLLNKYPDRSEVFSGHAHNNLVEMLGGTGILGTSAWLGWNGLVFALVISAARRRRKGSGEPAFARGLLAALIVYHLNGMTQVNFWEGKVLHQLMWMVAWTLHWRRDE